MPFSFRLFQIISFAFLIYSCQSNSTLSPEDQKVLKQFGSLEKSTQEYLEAQAKKHCYCLLEQKSAIEQMLVSAKKELAQLDARHASPTERNLLLDQLVLPALGAYNACSQQMQPNSDQLAKIQKDIESFINKDKSHRLELINLVLLSKHCPNEQGLFKELSQLSLQIAQGYQ